MKKILRATVISGIGSGTAIITGIIKSKVMAVLLGPAGIGLFGLLNSVMNTAVTVTGMGFATSGVRQIANAHSRGDDTQVALIRKALWISAWCTGLLGALLMIVFREPIARMTVGNADYSGAIMWLGIAVCVGTVSGTLSSLLNGLRLIESLTKVNVYASICSMIISVVAVWMSREKGIVIAICSVPVVSLCIFSWFSRGIKTAGREVSWKALFAPLRNMFSFSFFLMTTTLMTIGTQLAVRVIITKTLGMTATGHFHAAWSISTLYLGFVLGAMTTDYYPRLAVVASDPGAANNMVNEQTEAALLLTGPVILCMLALTPQVVGMLYSGAFYETVSVLRWQLLADLFKVASFPMAYILLAQGRGLLYFCTECSWNVIYLFTIWFGLKCWGIEAAGIAFLVIYVYYFCITLMIVRRLTTFTWSTRNLRLMSMLLACAAAIFFCARLSRSDVTPLAVGLILTAMTGGYSIMQLTRHVLRHDGTEGAS